MRKHLFVFALALMSLVSCKKDSPATGNNNGSDIPGQNPNTNPVPTAKVLKKLTQTSNGSSLVYNFTYQNKLLTSIKSIDNSDVTTFSYDGAGNVIKVENTTESWHNIYEYVYENGIPERATFKSYQIDGGVETLTEDDVVHYTVEGGKVTHINIDMNIVQQEVNFALTYDNKGNLTKIQGENGLEYTAEFTYGTKKPMFPQVFKFIMDHAGYSVHYFAKTDILSQSYDFPGTEDDFNNTVQNTYDANGYVLTSTDGDTNLTFEYQ